MAKIRTHFLILLGLVFGLFLLAVSIAIIRAVILPRERIEEICSPDEKDFISDERDLTKRFSEALKFETVSYVEHSYNKEALSKFIKFIEKGFPHIHSSKLITREVVGNLSLLYHVKGSDKSLKPYLLAGHMDVVPVEEDYWDIPPFSGQIKDGEIWGRGSADCKHIVMGVLEALEFLIEKGHKPKRSFYLAFGHDEEVGGLDGAQQIGKLLKSRKVTLEYILDEGGIILDNLIPGVNFPLALIGISEKGHMNFELSVTADPGHSSFPKRETPIVILAKALSKLEGDVFPSVFGKGPEKQMLEELAYCPVPFPLKVVLANIWLFKPLIPLAMRSPLTSALHRTTTAVTIVSGGNKVNVLPSFASATINLRLHPAQIIEESMALVESLINDKRINIKVTSQTDAHPISPIDSFGYWCIKRTIKQLSNDSCVVPTLLIANTDTKWYLGLSKSIYRFSYVHFPVSELGRFHGHNERIDVDNYVKLVNFFKHLIKNSDSSSITAKHTHEDL